ncbi:hypothetical protein N9B10_06985 [Pirellulales bacterium]|nr:hypothetical protein [Pirellulales bacterium]
MTNRKPNQSIEKIESILPNLFKHCDYSPETLENFIVLPIRDAEKFTREENDLPFFDSLDNDQQFDVNDGPTTDVIEKCIADNLDDLDLNGWPPTSDLPETFLGDWAGSPNTTDRLKGESFPPEQLAFYLPFHYFGASSFGIYITIEGVALLANTLHKYAEGYLDSLSAVHAARMFLYYHESYHHKVECFATRLELSHRQPFYINGFEQYYRKGLGTDHCLEEALANARALKQTLKQFGRVTGLEHALSKMVTNSPPGYRRGVAVGKKQRFDQIQNQLAEASLATCLGNTPRTDHSAIWSTMGHLFTGVSDISSRTNYLISRRSPLTKRMELCPPWTTL